MLIHKDALIIWPVSDAVLATSDARDTAAISYYQDIYKNSYSMGAVDEECLGILQYMSCALNYPTCSDTDDSI